MVDQLTLQTISIALAGLTVSIAAIYYMLTLRYTRRNQELTLKSQEQALETRQAQLFMSIYSKWYDTDFWRHYREVRQWEWKDYDDYVENYEAVPEKSSIWGAVGGYFEGLGVLVKRNLIDVTFVDDLISGPIMAMWQKFEPIILEDRRRKNVPTIWEWFEYLYDKVKEVAEKEHGPEHVVDMQRLDRRPESN